MESSDEEIKKRLNSKFLKDRFMTLSIIKTSVFNGIVTLEGTIISFWHKARAETTAKAVKGVKGIKNKLKINPKRSEIINDLMSDSLTNEKLRHIVDAHLSKIECYMGLLSVLFIISFLVIAILVTPGYSIFTLHVSTLGKGIGKTFFSIGFVTGGCLGIPFVIYLETTLIGMNEFIRRLATVLAIVSLICIALVGILPDPVYPDLFLIFHATITTIAFLGSVVYINLYTFLMLKSREFKIYYIIVGFGSLFNLILLMLTGFHPFVEWIVTFNILLFTFMVSIKLIRT